MDMDQQQAEMNLENIDQSLPKNTKCIYHGLKQAEFDERYQKLSKVSTSFRDKIKTTFQCSRGRVLALTEKYLPCVNVCRSYKVRDYLLGDIISGLSVGVMAIPQSLGYARLAQTPAILGLYTSFFPIIIYFFFASSRHVSLGMMALNSLVISSAIGGLEGSMFTSISGNGTNDSNVQVIHQTEEETKVLVAVSISFMAGLILVAMSIFRLGFIVSYMSEAFVSAYLAASNIRVLTHQVRDILGVTTKRHTGIFEYFFYVADICCNLPRTNLIQLAMSIVALMLLYGVKRFINERYRSKLRVPIPIDIIVVILATILSYFGNLQEKFGVKTLQYIPQGMPSPMLPSVTYMQKYIFDAVMLAIISYMMVGMMAKLFSQRHNYSVDNNQELMATGLSCIGGAFFCSLAPSTSPPRCFLMESTGGRTQVTYLISALLALLTMLFIAPLFSALPVCILACIIIVACIPLFVHYIAWITYFKTDKYDFAIWIVTCFSTLIVSVEMGLLIGIGFSLVVVHFRMQRPHSTVLVQNQTDGIFLEDDLYRECHSRNDVALFRFESPLYFATLDVFKEQLFAKTVSVSYLKLKAKKNLSNANHEQHNGVSNNKANKIISNVDSGNVVGHLVEEIIVDVKSTEVIIGSHVDQEASNMSLLTPVKWIILDCSAITFLDTSGAKLLAHLYSEYSNFKITLALAECRHDIVEKLKKVDLCKQIVDQSLYPTIQDAVLSLTL